jgi:hypothetical protein
MKRLSTYRLHSLILMATIVLSPLHGSPTEAAKHFKDAISAIKTQTESISKNLDAAITAEREVRALEVQIEAKQKSIEDLKQRAEQLANDLAMQQALQNRNPSGGGGGGGGAGSGSGANRPELSTPELPEMPEPAKFELGEGPQPIDLGDIGSQLGFTPPRGALQSGIDLANPLAGFQAPSLANNSNAPKRISPETVASGILPQLSGEKSIGSPIDGGAAAAAANGGPGGNAAGGAGAGMLGGMGGGGAMSPGGGDMGGDVMSGVGAEAPFTEGGLRVQSMQMGDSGGAENGEASSANAGPDAGGVGADESPVKAQRVQPSAERGVASAAKTESELGRGLMSWIGWVGDTCRESASKLDICKGPLLSAEKATIAAQPKPESEWLALGPERSVASEYQETEQNYGPVRAGLLGLVSGK